MTTTAERNDLPSRELATQYDPAVAEVPLYQRWLDAGYFRADAQRGPPRGAQASLPAHGPGG